MERLRGFCAQHPRSIPFIVTAVALAVRALALTSFSRTVYSSNLAPDEQVYDVAARMMMDGKSAPDVVGFDVSIPARLFYFAYALIAPEPSSVRIVNLVLGTLSCTALFFVGKAIRDDLTGLLSGLVAALYGPFVLASVTAHKTALTLLLISAAMLFGARSVARGRIADVALLGVALALSAHTRGNAVLLVAAAPIALWLTWKARFDTAEIAKNMGAYAVAVGVTLIPLSQGGVLGAPEHGFNLFMANTLDNPAPYFRPVRFAPSQPNLQGGGFTLKASLESGRRLSVDDAGDYYHDKLVEEWRARPRLALRKVLEKLGASINAYEHAHNQSLEFLSRFVWPLRLSWVGFGIVFPLALLGGVGKVRTAHENWLLLMAGAYWLTLVIFFSEVRLRAPLALLLIPIAAAGLVRLVERNDWSWTSKLSLIALGAALTHIPNAYAGDLSSAYNLHALILFESGDLDGAEKYYRKSTTLAGIDSGSAYLGLAAVAAKRGELERSSRHLAKVPDGHYKASEKYAQLGALLVQTNELPAAAAAFERAIEINPGFLQSYPILRLIYLRLEQPVRAEDIEERAAYAKTFFE